MCFRCCVWCVSSLLSLCVVGALWLDAGGSGVGVGCAVVCAGLERKYVGRYDSEIAGFSVGRRLVVGVAWFSGCGDVRDDDVVAVSDYVGVSLAFLLG